MKKLYSVLLMIFILACSESDPELSTPVDGPRNYFSGETGSYWYYETYAKDQNDRDSLISKDSIVVEETVEFKGRESKKCKIFKMTLPSTSYEDGGNFYMSTETDKLFIHSEGFLNLLGGGASTPIGDPSDFLQIEEQWILAADKNESRWDVFESEIAFQFGLFDVTGDSEAKGRRISTSNLVEIGGARYWVDEYDINNEGNLELDLGLPIPLELDFEIDYTIELGGNLGIYSIYTLPSEIDIPGQELPESVPTEQRLIRFNIIN